MANTVNGLRVLVQGDLPDELMDRIQESVRRTVLRELAEVDLAAQLQEKPLRTVDPVAEPGTLRVDDGVDPLDLLGIPFPLGLWLIPKFELPLAEEG